jgi:outer membrane protein OmpA-like peptidoglycan-associated protein
MRYIYFLTLLVSFVSYSQKEANIWYFGRNAGLDFSSGKAVSLTDGQLSTEEGCSVISDKNGKLLFYTDGISVWNKNHKLMPNASGLKGDPSSTSSGVAIPKPNSSGKYYLFTVAKEASVEGLKYSLIDMSLDSLRGDVVNTEKNIPLQTKITEKLTAVSHRNGKDFWVIAHKWESDEFISFLVTEKGISKDVIVSKVGLVHKGKLLNTQGYMKSNPDGSNIALALEDDNIIELFDFDNATGQVSNPIQIKFPVSSFVYGIEFSPNGSILYVSAAGTGEIYQINLQLESPEAIQKSLLKIGQSPKKEWIGALQIANDGKIYFPIYKTDFLGVIEKPNEIGVACNYLNNYVSLDGKKASLGLPTFSQNFFNQEVKESKMTYFDASKVELNKTLILKNITFDFSKYSLKPSSNIELDKVVTILKKNPTYKILITGHTDNIGNKSSNLILSQNRAKTVKEYLISKGISSERVSSEGKGSILPVATNTTDEGRAKNRRVEFVLK